MNEGLFRQKNVDRISSPDQLGDYIRVADPGLWLLLGAIVLLLVGMLVWASFGTVSIHTADGAVKLVRPITFVLN